MTTHKRLFRGVWTALVTPFTDADATHVDVPALRALVTAQLDAGVSGLVPCGTTGETATLSVAEQDLVITTTLQTVGGRVPVVAGAGANDTRSAIENHKRVAALGVQGALHVTPWYNKPTQEGLYRHFRAVADSADLPIILYNVPGRTGVDLLPETVARLAADEPKFVAIKEATGSVQRSQEVLNRVRPNRPDFSVLSGDDGHILSLLALGGDGVISVTSHLCAGDLAAMVAAFERGDIATAQALSQKTSPLANALFFRSNPIPVKTALALQGHMLASFRLPLCPLSDAEVATLKASLQGWL
jgi:4-hydroxy-tetrahydrodipicolinate synthase